MTWLTWSPLVSPTHPDHRYPTLVHVWKHHVQGSLNFNNRGKTPEALRAMLKIMLELLRGMEALVWCSDKMNP